MRAGGREEGVEQVQQGIDALVARDAPGDGTSRAGVISSSLELGDGTWIGLALVRKQALGQPVLQAGDGPRPATLLLS